jgi:hypothetical protein
VCVYTYVQARTSAIVNAKKIAAGDECILDRAERAGIGVGGADDQQRMTDRHVTGDTDVVLRGIEDRRIVVNVFDVHLHKCG